MKKIIPFVLLLLTAFILNAQETKLSADEVIIFKEKISKAAKENKTISNSFEQIKHIDFLSNDIISKGALFFKAPNMIKWSYTDPYLYSVIFKEKRLYINDSGKKSDINLASNKTFKKLNDLIVKSVNGDMLLDGEQFIVSYTQTKSIYKTNLIPKDKKLKEMFDTVQLEFDKKSMLVVNVKFIEASGDYTLIRFTNKFVNKPIADEVFNN